MNEFVIGKAWKKEIITYLLCDCIFIYGMIYAPTHKYAFLFKPALIISVWVFYTTYKHRKEQIRFDEYGITLEDGTLCKWQNIKLLEYKRTGLQSMSLVVHTKNHVYNQNVVGFEHKHKELYEYMSTNHPEIRFDMYVKFIFGTPFPSSHVYTHKSNLSTKGTMTRTANDKSDKT